MIYFIHSCVSFRSIALSPEHRSTAPKPAKFPQIYISEICAEPRWWMSLRMTRRRDDTGMLSALLALHCQRNDLTPFDEKCMMSFTLVNVVDQVSKCTTLNKHFHFLYDITFFMSELIYDNDKRLNHTQGEAVMLKPYTYKYRLRSGKGYLSIVFVLIWCPCALIYHNY